MHIVMANEPHQNMLPRDCQRRLPMAWVFKLVGHGAGLSKKSILVDKRITYIREYAGTRTQLELNARA